MSEHDDKAWLEVLDKVARPQVERLRAELSAEREARERAEAACAEHVSSWNTLISLTHGWEFPDAINAIIGYHSCEIVGTDLLERLRKAEGDITEKNIELGSLYREIGLAVSALTGRSDNDPYIKDELNREIKSTLERLRNLEALCVASNDVIEELERVRDAILFDHSSPGYPEWWNKYLDTLHWKVESLNTSELKATAGASYVREVENNNKRLLDILKSLFDAYIEENGGDMPTNDDHPAHEARAILTVKAKQ